MANSSLYLSKPPNFVTFQRDFMLTGKAPSLREVEWKNVDVLAYAGFRELSTDFEVVTTGLDQLSKFNHIICNWYVFQNLNMKGKLTSSIYPVPTMLLETRKIFAYCIEDFIFNFDTMIMTRKKHSQGYTLEVE